MNPNTSLRRRGRRALPAVLALLLAACGGGSSDNPAPAPEARAGALSAAAPGELVQWAQGRLRTLDAQGRLASGGPGTLPMPTLAPVAGGATAGVPTSRTLVQEDGVDEADLLQLQGRVAHALLRGSANSDGAALELLSQPLGDDNRLGTARRTPLAGDGVLLQPEGLLARSDGQALVAVARRQEPVGGAEVCPDCLTIAPVWMKSGVQVQLIDTRDAARPVAGNWLAIEGSLVDVRRVGDTLVLVALHRPLLPAQALPAAAPALQRAAAINNLSADELLPRLRRNGGAPQPLLRDTDCWLQRDNGSVLVQLTTVTLINLADATLPQSTRCFAGGTEAVYLTPQNLWLATTRGTPLAERLTLTPPPLQTDVHQFALDLTGTGGLAWRGSATVDGHLGWDRERMSYRLSEHAGHLRVLTYTGSTGWAALGDAASTAGSPARLTLLRSDSAAASADGRTLATVATLPNERRPAAIGKPGEQVYAVRFVGERGYVVTFRQVDPLYVLDLATPSDPRVAGEVELPGYSHTLLPLDGGLLLGLGRDADAEGRLLGLQFTLFDVADASAPRVLQTVTLGSQGSASALDFARHGLAMRVDGAQARLALPVMLTDTPFGEARRGLQTFTVDTAARTLATGTLKGEIAGSSQVAPLGEERAALVGEQLLHLRAGALGSYDW